MVAKLYGLHTSKLYLYFNTLTESRATIKEASKITSFKFIGTEDF